ncbi:MAG TPA: S53 family peptidase [Actinomycetota bacterium]|nr:S53 family peptidase [Actinomycetota bacterium]
MSRWFGACMAVVIGLSVSFVPSAASARPTGAHHTWGHRKVCHPTHVQKVAGCQALVVTTTPGGVTPMATPAPTGYGPSDLSSAYGYPSPAGTTWTWNGRTVAIVDAYDNPNAAGDAAAYRQAFGLPPCTTASGCFTKVAQSAKAKLPSGNVGWGQEIDLDIEMASAVCPQCKILLVEARSASFLDLGAAENRAASLGATAISNSYAGGESFFSSLFESYYNHPGVAITAASGDSGYGSAYPASSPHVIAVGGTTLTLDPTTHARVSEVAWSGGGSWCSTAFGQPGWQQGLVTADPSGYVCVNRTVADVAADADPQTGVSVFDTYGSSGSNDWFRFGGTSVPTPLIAALFSLAGDATHNSAYPYPARWLYTHPSSLFDVTTGSNGNATDDCYPNTGDPYYLCHAKAGFDGPTGLGTPNGTAAF